MIGYYITAFVSTFIVTALAARLLIPKLRSMKLGQKILDVGPRWHKSKEGTPTMGGLSFIAAALIVFIPFAVYLVSKGVDGVDRMAIVMLMATANGAVGIVDDLTKFKNHRNEGLTASQKYLLQLICAGLFLAAMKLSGNLSETLYIPYVGVELDLGILY